MDNLESGDVCWLRLFMSGWLISTDMMRLNVVITNGRGKREGRRMKQKSQKEHLIDLIPSNEWQTAKEISTKTGLNSYQIGMICRRFIIQGLIEFRDKRMRVFGVWRKIRQYRRKRDT